MTVKVAPPIDITPSFNSSIPEPDAGRGEVEWEGLRLTSLGAVRNFPKICASNGVVFYAAGSSAFRSTNNATSWQSVDIKFTTSSARFSASHGSIFVVCGSAGQVSISTNSAQSFSLSSFNFSGKDLVSVSVLGSSIFIISADGFVFRSSNSGGTFQNLGQIDSTTQFSRIAIKYGKILAGSASGSIYVSNDLGVSFSKKLELENSTVRLTGFAGFDGTIVAVGEFGFIYNSSDLGETWTKTNAVGATTEFFTISECDGFTLLAGMKNFSEAAVFISTDAGVTLKEIQSGINSAQEGIDRSLISSSASFSDYFIYGSNVGDRMIVNRGYKAGEEAIKQSIHKKYRCAVEATFDDPELGVNLSLPTWTEIGATNRWAIMDSSTSQRSVFNGGGNVSCSVTSPVDVVGIFGVINVNSVTLTIKQGATTLYTETKSAIDPLFSDTNIKDMVFFTPPFENVQIIINFTGSDCQVGRFAVGRTSDIGRAVTGTELGDIDYSTIEYDNFGRTVYRERPIVPYHNLQIDVAKSKSISISRKIQSLRGLDVMWIADIGLDEPLIAIGRCERSPITYTNPSLVSYSLKIRGTA